jgi:hypothetical protein
MILFIVGLGREQCEYTLMKKKTLFLVILGVHLKILNTFALKKGI